MCACECRRVQGCVSVHTCVQACAGTCRLRVTVENGSPGSVPGPVNSPITSETGQGPGLRGHLLIYWADQF